MRDFFSKYESKFIPEPMSGCWIWTGATAGATAKGYGYGHFNRRGCHFYAHRCSYEAINGSARGKIIRHRCDFPPCVNPEHLLAGTQIDNTNDSVRRGRANRAFGEQSGRAKIIEIDAVAIRQMAKEGITINTIRRGKAIGRNQVTSILKAKSWRHLGPPIEYARQKPIPPHGPGEKNNRSILTEIEAQAILNDTKTSGVNLARRYGVSTATISAIRVGRNWKHLVRGTG
jgi:hypothetical protein